MAETRTSNSDQTPSLIGTKAPDRNVAQRLAVGSGPVERSPWDEHFDAPWEKDEPDQSRTVERELLHARRPFPPASDRRPGRRWGPARSAGSRAREAA